MKKILHISGTTIAGGGPEHIFQLLKRLNQNEWEIIICTLNDGLYWKKFNSLGIKTYNLTLRILSLKTAYKLFLIIRKEKPDLIHTHGKGPGFYGRTISAFLNIPTVHTFHGFHYEDLKIFTRWIHLAVENFLSLFTDQHIFVSTGEKNRARVLKFLDETNSIVIHNGIDQKYIDSLPITRSKALELSENEDWEKNKIKENKKSYVKDMLQGLDSWENESMPEIHNSVGIEKVELEKEQWNSNKEHVKKLADDARKYLYSLLEEVDGEEDERTADR